MNMKGKSGNMWPIAIIAVIAIVVFGPALQEKFLGAEEASTPAGTPASNLLACPDDGDTSLTLNLQNLLNETAAETFDASIVLESNAGDYQTGTDTTDGAYTINCGETYTLSVTRTDGDAGDNSMIEKIIVGPGAEVTSGGKVVFTPTQSAYALRVGGSQHGVLEFRAYDNNAAGFMCDSDDSCTSYETDGVSFESTTNGTALAVGVGGEMDISFDIRSTRPDTDFTDLYTLILVEAPVATWNEPVLKLEGQKLVDVKGTLTADEEKQFSGYEYIYKVDTAIEDDGVDLDFYMKALAGVNPSTDPEIDFAAGGYFTSIDGVTVLAGAADDTSSSAVTFTVQDVTIDIS